MGAVYELPGGSRVVLYTSADVDALVRAANLLSSRVEAFPAGECRNALESLTSTIDQGIRELDGNAILTRRVETWNIDVPEEYVGGSWLTALDATDLRAAFNEFPLEESECEKMEDISGYVQFPPESSEAPPLEEVVEAADEVLAIGTTSDGGTAMNIALGLGAAAATVGLVYLVMKGKR